MRKKIIKWLSSKFQFVIRNDADLKELSIYRLSNLKFIFILFSTLIVIFIFLLYLSTTMLKYWFDPRFAEQLANQQVVNLSKTVDSLINESEIKDNYISNVRSILSGEETFVSNNSNKIKNNIEDPFRIESSSDELNSVDSIFRKQFEELNNNFLINNIENNYDDILNINLFPPVSRGIISSQYNINNRHYGIDILCNKDEAIKSVGDGVVIMSSWTRDSGYVLAIYHNNNLISIYKHNAKLLKKVGETVTSGDIVSIVGNTGEFTSGPHLHLELWLNGKSINPSEFISF